MICMESNMNIHIFPRPRLFEFGHESDTSRKVVISLVFACFMGLMAQIRFYLPWTPVPVTGQTFAVLLAAVILGKTWGGASTAMYVGAGAAGVPWFSGWTGGMGGLTGATGGYLIGFIVAALFVGHAVDRYPSSRKFTGMLLILLSANFILIYGLGLIYLYVWLSMVAGISVGLWELLLMGAIPFVAGDIVKVFFSTAVTNWFTPKHALR